MTDFVKGELAGIAVVIAVVAAAIACGQLLRGDDARVPRAAIVVQDAAPAACPCPAPSEDGGLMRELSACKDELSSRTPIKTKIVKVEVPAKRCAENPPEIAPVATTECSPGQTCLDAAAQRALTKNLTAYEAWVRRVQECEQGPAKK